MSTPAEVAAIAQRAHDLEDRLKVLRGNAPSEPGEDTIGRRKGRTPVVFVSAHGVPHWRGSAWKSREPFTASVAWQAAETADASSFVLQAVLAEDANYDRAGYVKAELAAFIERVRPALVIDVHGADVSREFDVAIGSRGGASLLGRPELLETVRGALKERGLRVLVVNQGLFAATFPRTLCAYTSTALGVPALQIELNRDVRRPVKYSERYAAVVLGLAEAARAVAPRTEEDLPAAA